MRFSIPQFAAISFLNEVLCVYIWMMPWDETVLWTNMKIKKEKEHVQQAYESFLTTLHVKI